MQGISYIFFIFLKDLFYKLSLGCNTSHFLMIFLWKVIKNSYYAIKNLKKLWLQAKFSNFWMQLVLIKNILWFSHNKLDKHLISSKKDPSRVPMFVSHNGTRSGRNRFTINFQYIWMTSKSIKALSKNSTKHLGSSRFKWLHINTFS